MEDEEIVNMLRAGKVITFRTNISSIGSTLIGLFGAGFFSLGLALMLFLDFTVGLVFLGFALFVLWTSFNHAAGMIIGNKVILKRYLTNTRYQITLDDIEDIDQEEGIRRGYRNHTHTTVTFSVAGKTHTLMIITPDGFIGKGADPAHKILHMAIELDKIGML